MATYYLKKVTKYNSTVSPNTEETYYTEMDHITSRMLFKIYLFCSFI